MCITSGIVFKDVICDLCEVSVGMCKGNYVLYKRSLHALGRVSGNAFCTGADIPTSEIV